MSARIITAGILCAASLLVASAAHAAPLRHPDADSVASSSTVLTTLAERRLVHHELIQRIIDGQ